ncbi:DUF2256 and DUF3253 domain-containing protein [Aquihabitans sp. G128]|uniref:DUF3253 domain-containing protein n=1 Tax=Aquihabitans sp. G128 TaxID=2849779 RepID=UPI001C23FEBB|nr:DUF2256 and DUF3253 domain-containing protein [Aquihabitans sp. G128]
MHWRKRWERSWDEVRHCSAACRRRGVRPVDHELEAAILQLLAAGPRGRAVDPEEAAREVGGDGWESLREPARSAARRLHAQGQAVVTQGGKRVDPSTAKGPIEVARP